MAAEASIESLYIYPIKGLPGLEVSSWHVMANGMMWDRSWMLIHQDGSMISQRTYPELTQFGIEHHGDSFQISWHGQFIHFRNDEMTSKHLLAQIWDHQVPSQVVSESVNAFFTEILKTEVLMVRQSYPHTRKKNIPLRKEEIPLQYTDGYPIHLVNRSSLEEVFEKAQIPTDVRRFRPNILVKGLAASEEENFRVITTPNVSLDLIKPTVRCSVPNVDPDSGRLGKQPIKALSTYKKKGNQIEFGVYCGVLRPGIIRIGDLISFS